ncbi:MAG TPA: rhomboid family intramembrane serine protease [Candidatus Bathyarchaeia archaeon]
MFLKLFSLFHNKWIFLPRFGNLSNWEKVEVHKGALAIMFEESEKQTLCDLVIGHFDTMFQTSDDMYICSEAGNTVISVDHHLFNDGLNIYINDYALKFPKVRLGMLLFFRWYRIPVGIMLFLWLLVQIFGALQQVSGFGNVSALGHLGGAFAGFLFWLHSRRPYSHVERER